MNLQGIVNISGKPGLYKVISSSKTGFIVEAIDASRKRLPIPGNARVAALDDISVYTLEDQVSLKDVFQRIHDEKIDLSGIDTAKDDPQAIVTAFKKLIPDYDAERVYLSDMRKLIRWYQILSPVLDFSKEEAAEEPAAAATEEEKPKATKAKKKAENESDSTSEDVKPAKKAAKKAKE